MRTARVVMLVGACLAAGGCQTLSRGWQAAGAGSAPQRAAAVDAAQPALAAVPRDAPAVRKVAPPPPDWAVSTPPVLGDRRSGPVDATTTWGHASDVASAVRAEPSARAVSDARPAEPSDDEVPAAADDAWTSAAPRAAAGAGPVDAQPTRRPRLPQEPIALPD
jgi:hypothetical protein